ncbi:MAG: hypothetical protein M0Z66_06210 [Thermaerobacter sp.]|nr:hypothetical protein [Thermaerobacter sp.]
MSWQRLIELLQAQQACLEDQDFTRHKETLSPQIAAVLASLEGGPPPTEAERTRVESLLDATLDVSKGRIARTGASARRATLRRAALAPQLIDRRG